MMTDTYYKDHWSVIDSERFDRYVKMFSWSEDSRPLFAPANICADETVVEIGCGPGFTACEIAKWVGPNGAVDGLDINADFIKFGNTLARERSLQDRVKFHHVSDSTLPFGDMYADCIVAKNVFIYVDDPVATYEECFRVIKPGGRVHVVEGDWGLVFAEPVTETLWNEFIEAAGIAFRTPKIGRKLLKYAKAAGFDNITVASSIKLDTAGRLLPMINNLCAYARQSGKLEERKIDQVKKTCEDAAREGSLLICAPQFLVTATR